MKFGTVKLAPKSFKIFTQGGKLLPPSGDQIVFGTWSLGRNNLQERF